MKPENYLKAAEMAMEDDYGMIDGVINNGKKEEPVEKASVLDQLKEKQELCRLRRLAGAAKKRSYKCVLRMTNGCS